jgi:hypothetical protein
MIPSVASDRLETLTLRRSLRWLAIGLALTSVVGLALGLGSPHGTFSALAGALMIVWLMFAGIALFFQALVFRWRDSWTITPSSFNAFVITWILACFCAALIGAVLVATVPTDPTWTERLLVGLIVVTTLGGLTWPWLMFVQMRREGTWRPGRLGLAIIASVPVLALAWAIVLYADLP